MPGGGWGRSGPGIGGLRHSVVGGSVLRCVLVVGTSGPSPVAILGGCGGSRESFPFPGVACWVVLVVVKEPPLWVVPSANSLA